MRPAERHKAMIKQARTTNHIERFNNTWRQRVARLGRETLSCAKKLAHPSSALTYYICYDKRTRVTTAAVPV